MNIRPATDADRPRLEPFLRANHSLRVARLGRLETPLSHPMLIAGDLDGVLTYILDGPSCEILTLHTDRQWSGTGTALLTAVRSIAQAAGCRRLWLITTNDNTDALRFYQRRGFHLAALRPGAVDEARRTLKPEIPTTGLHGIPIRDELELESRL